MLPVLKIIYIFYLMDVSSDSAGDNCSNLRDSNDFNNFSKDAMICALFKKRRPYRKSRAQSVLRYWRSLQCAFNITKHNHSFHITKHPNCHSSKQAKTDNSVTIHCLHRNLNRLPHAQMTIANTTNSPAG